MLPATNNLTNMIYTLVQFELLNNNFILIDNFIKYSNHDFNVISY